MHSQTRTDETASNNRQVCIELLALDLATCGRCTRTEANLDAAVRSVAGMLRQADIEVATEKQVVTSIDEAERLRLVTSPTIRVNGKDIALDLRESPCDDCGEICGCKGGVNCRVWAWQGKEYLEAPKAMIVDAILKAYSHAETVPEPPSPYSMPENLRTFFLSPARKQTTTAPAKACCDKDSCCKT
jgi:uncharacterized protein DUF2703